MASDLERFRDHARRMAAATEPVEVTWAFTPPGFDPNVRTLPNGRGYGQIPKTVIDPPTDLERELWTRLAEEIDAYLTPDQAQEEPLPW